MKSYKEKRAKPRGRKRTRKMRGGQFVKMTTTVESRKIPGLLW